MAIVILMIILIPILHQMTVGLLDPNQFPTLPGYNETIADKHVDNWLVDNLKGKNPTIASNNAAGTFLKTSFKSVGFPPPGNQNEFEKVLDYYNASYLVFYDVDKHNNEYYYEMHTWNVMDFNYHSVFSYNYSHIFKLTNLIDSADISKPVLYVQKASKFERLGNVTAATKIYDEVMNYSTTILVDEQFCDGLKQTKKYVLAIAKCNQILNKNPADLVALKDLADIYQITNQTEKIVDVLKPEITAYVLAKDYDKAISVYDDLINTIKKKIGTPNSNIALISKSLIDTSLAKATLLSNIGRYDDADQAYQDVIRLDMFNKEAHEKRAELLEKMGYASDAQKEFEFVNRLNLMSKS